MKTNSKGLTLVELLLTIAIVGIIVLTLFQSVRYSMDVLQRANSHANLQIIRIMRQISRDLRCAFLPSTEYPAVSFTGTKSSIKFVSVVPLYHDWDGSKGYNLKEKRYYLVPQEEGNLLALKVSTKDIRATGKSREKEKEQTLSSSIGSVNFAYSDGEQWRPSWNSFGELPESVRVTVRFGGDGSKNSSEYFSTVIMLPSA
jgi:prepilin-type N-terminal cleavage/methylation domain-containing protein